MNIIKMNCMKFSKNEQKSQEVEEVKEGEAKESRAQYMLKCECGKTVSS